MIQPYQVPELDYNLFKMIDEPERRAYHAIVHHMDGMMGKLVARLRARGMWENTLIVFSADNGGPITQAANNYPLRGGKHSNFDGGVRVAAFVSGGWLPPQRRGVNTSALIAIWDWYATFGAIAGLTTEQMFDKAAAAAGLPPIDSIDQSATLLEDLPDLLYPRQEIFLGSCSNARHDPFCQSDPGMTVVQGVVANRDGGLIKLLLGDVPLDCVVGPIWPNGSALNCPWHDCGLTGCLYNLTSDPSESMDLIANSSSPSIVDLATNLRERVQRHTRTVFSPNRGYEDLTGACEAALHVHGGFWGPWLPTHDP
jgi:arylsulfatase B